MQECNVAAVCRWPDAGCERLWVCAWVWGCRRFTMPFAWQYPATSPAMRGLLLAGNERGRATISVANAPKGVPSGDCAGCAECGSTYVAHWRCALTPTSAPYSVAMICGWRIVFGAVPPDLRDMPRQPPPGRTPPGQCDPDGAGFSARACRPAASVPAGSRSTDC